VNEKKLIFAVRNDVRGSELERNGKIKKITIFLDFASSDKICCDFFCPKSAANFGNFGQNLKSCEFFDFAVPF
jgi:hypothetical protein